MSHQPNPTQQDRIYTILKALKENDHTIPAAYLFLDRGELWVSGRYLKQVMYISEANGRISELRGKGFNILTHDQKDEFGFAYHRLSDEPMSEPVVEKKRSGKRTGPKLFVMGEEQPFEDLPEPDAATMEHYFVPVKLSPAAIDRASQVVPEQYWLPVGLYSWLERRANEAFKKMPTSAKEFELGKLKYLFEYTDQGPQLRMVVLNGK